MKQRVIPTLFGIWACFAGAGCLVVDMKLNNDGSGTMRVEFLALREEGDKTTSADFPTQQEEVAALFAGVEIVSYEPGDTPVIEIAFSAVEQLVELPLWQALEVRPLEVERDGDAIIVRANATKLRDSSMRRRLAGEDETQQVLRLRVRTAGEIESSNAHEAEKRAATWSYTILDLWKTVAPTMEWTYRVEAAQPAPAAGRGEPARPNIIVFLADDMGSGDVHAYDPNSTIPTPNIDRIAADGVRFTHAYAPSAVCTPSRYALLTGRYAFRSRLATSVLFSAYARPILDAEHETIAELFLRAGYRTAAFGKWHLGMLWQDHAGKGLPAVLPFTYTTEDVDFSKPILDGPLQHGFQYFFGLASSINHDPYAFVENDRVTEIPTRMRPDVRHDRGNFHGGWIADSWDDSQQGVVVSGRALEYITRHVEEHSTQPFFMYYAATANHLPHVPPAELHGHPIAGRGGNDDKLPQRNDMIVENDVILGLLMQRLEDPNGDGDRSDSIADDTLVIVASDNGADFGAAPGLRGLKGLSYEGGYRIPLMARWPRRIPAGEVNEQPLSLVDFYATFAALTETAPADGAAEDSENVLPALYGEKIERGPIFLQESGTGATFAVRKGNWKLIVKQGRPEALFHLRSDSREMRNRAADEPLMVALLMREYERVRGRRPVSTPGAPAPSTRGLRTAPRRKVD